MPLENDRLHLCTPFDELDVRAALFAYFGFGLVQ
jgi:hypothetical protein